MNVIQSKDTTMMKWLRRFFRRITGISTPVGGISWKSSDNSLSKLPTFSKPIYMTYSDNDDFILFLDSNEHRIVFLDTCIDASVTFKKQFEFAEKVKVDLHVIASGTFSGVELPLPNKQGDRITATFYFSDNPVLRYSAGGTGIITVGFNGFFEVSRTAYSGPTTAFHLKEIKASLETKVEILNR